MSVRAELRVCEGGREGLCVALFRQSHEMAEMLWPALAAVEVYCVRAHRGVGEGVGFSRYSSPIRPGDQTGRSDRDAIKNCNTNMHHPRLTLLIASPHHLLHH